MPNNNPARYWLITIPFEAWTRPQALPEGMEWIKGQEEIGAGGYRHHQVCCRFTKTMRLPAVKRAFGAQAHCEPSRSAAASEYVWKDDTAVEGTRFEFGKIKKTGSQVDWQAVRAAAREGRFDTIDDSVYMRYTSNILRVHALHARPQLRPEIELGKVYWGPTNTGKSHRAYEEALASTGGTYFKSPTNKWWDGYQGEENVIIDEFTGMIAIEHLLKWMDKWPCCVEIKGGTTPLRAVRFWITSNLCPLEWYPTSTREQKAALERRIDLCFIPARGELVR